MTSRLGFLGCGAVLTVLGWPGEWNATPAPTAPPVSRPLIGVTVPSQVAQVAPEQAGKIVDMPFKAGDRVTRDQVLFRLNSTLQELEVERLRPLAESDLVVRRATAELAHERQKTARLRDLENQEITSAADLLDQVHRETVAELKLQQARIEQGQARNRLAQAIERLEQQSVRSPFDGIVTLRMKSAGESVERFVPVLEVMSFDPLWIEFDCPTHRIREFEAGTRIEVTPARQPDEKRTAVVEFVSPKGNAASHTLMVRATLRNPSGAESWGSGLKVLVQRLEQPTGQPAARPARPGK